MEVPERIEQYRLEEKLGEGGMGVVYRAWDEDLERRVAVKFIHRERRQSVSRQKRFRREALTVARLVHPAIVQIHHQLRFEGGEGIVMELVEGESLARHLAAGPLAPETAVALLLEVAEGLAYAHGEGFVHRDLKAENVMVTRTGHAKILDFGLAKWPEATTLSDEGAVLGTLHTMSPEQAQGLDVDHRTDLFSLGVLLYETLTGTSPFRAESAREVLARVIHHHPLPVAKCNPAVSQELSGLCDRLLAKDPASRPQSSAEVVSILARLAGTASRLDLGNPPAAKAEHPPEAVLRTTPTVVERLVISRSWHRGALVGVLILLAVLISLVFVGDSARPVLVVADFENLSGRDEMDWIGAAVARNLTTNLLADEKLRRPAGSHLITLRAPITASDRERLRKGYGVDVLIVGSYTAADDTEGSTLEIHCLLQDVDSGNTMAETTLHGREEELFDLVREAALELRRDLRIDEMPVTARQAAQALFPNRFDTARLYFQALEWLRSSDARRARELLMAALELEGDSPLLHDALAKAMTDLGYVERAREEARLAWQLSSELPRRRQLEIEARHRESMGSWDEAIRIYRDLSREFPDEIDVGVWLAQVLIDAGKPTEALEHLERLYEESTAVVELGIVGVEMTRAKLEIDATEEALEIVTQAAAQAQRIGAVFLEARARLYWGEAFDRVGRYEPALASFERALNLFDQSDSRSGVLDAATSMAIVYAYQGKYTEAEEKFKRYREIYRERGDRLTEVMLSVNLANIWSMQGKLEDARRLYDGTLTVLEDLEARSEAATTALNLGAVHQDLGELAQARVSYGKAVTEFEELGDRENLANARANLAEVFYWSGDLDRAQELLEEAYANHEASGELSWLAYDGFRLGEIFAARDLPDEARQHFDKALELCGELSDEVLCAEIDLSYARMELGRMNLDDARKRAERAKTVFLDAGLNEEAALARIVLARTFLQPWPRDLKRARELYDDAEFGAQGSESFRVRIELDLLSARIAAISTEGAAEAAMRFKKIAQEATERDFVPYSFEATLALGHLEMTTFASVAGRERLEGLAADARLSGWEIVARRAESFIGH